MGAGKRMERGGAEANGESGAAFTVREAVVRGAQYLQERGSPTARLDAELLVCDALGLDRLGLYMNMDRPLDAAERERARGLVMRRGRLEPVAHILGRREFYGHEFEVTAETLVPRPETEFLVDCALEFLKALDAVEAGATEPDGVLAADLPIAAEDSPAGALIAPGVRSAAAPPELPRRILEVGAGTGCVSISLALARPRLELVATELCPAAAAVARRNAQAHEVQDRVTIRHQSGFEGLAELARAPLNGAGPDWQPGFDGLVSNPPYVAERDRETLATDVREYEPATALFSGHDGLDCIRWLLREAPALLKPGAFAAIEIGHDQADAVEREAEYCGWTFGGFRRDYAGHRRIALMQWLGNS